MKGSKSVGGSLEADESPLVETWITSERVAKFTPGTPHRESGTPCLVQKLRNRHWAFQPVRNPPTGGNSVTPSPGRNLFLAAALTKAGFEHRRPPTVKLLIRMWLGLTGLPPRPLEVDLFVRR